MSAAERKKKENMTPDQLRAYEEKEAARIRKEERINERKIDFEVKMPNIPALDSFDSNNIFLKDEQSIYAYLSGNYEFFKESKNFQRHWSHMEESILFNYEDKLMPGDYVMIWPNPDL